MKGEIMKKIIILLIILVFMAGCGEKKVDSSSDESFKKSIESMKTSLSEEKKNLFFLLQTKCDVLARDLGVPVGSIVAKWSLL